MPDDYQRGFIKSCYDAINGFKSKTLEDSKVANEKANALDASTLPDGRALEVSGTTNFQGHTYVTGNLFVSDIVVAQEFHTEFVSASITFSSGSNKMGVTSDDVHQMSVSLRVSGAGSHY